MDIIEKLKNKITLGDSLEVMKQLPDKCIDLVLTDPPYGISCDGGSYGLGVKPKTTTKKSWDKGVPEKEYFDEMFRVSKNQIIFGGNYMITRIGKNSPCWIVWDKDNTGNYADAELAWTSFNRAVKKYCWRWNGMIQQDMKNKEIRIHPTQKPVRLMEMILRDFYDKESGGVVADFYSGSGSVAIACYNMGIPFISVEKRLEYYQASVKRLQDVQAQMKLFRGI